KTALAGAVLGALVVGVTTACLGWLLKPGVELLFGESQAAAASPVPALFAQHPLIMVPLALIFVTLIRLCGQLLQVTLINRVGHTLVGQIQTQLFSRMLHADLATLRQHHSGHYLSSVLFDAGLMREAATTGMVNYTQHTVIVLGTLVAMASIDPWLTLGVLVSGPVISSVLSGYIKRTKKAAQGAMEATATLSTAIMESLDGIKIVKIAGQEPWELDRVSHVIAGRQRHIIKGANARATAAPVTEALTSIVTALVIAYAGWRAADGSMTLGGFMGFIVLLGAAGQSLRQLANLQTVMNEGLTAAVRLFDALDITPEITDPVSPAPVPARPGEIRLDGVRFGYKDEAPVLNDLSLSVSPGQTLALVGPSGSGKSTVLNLIARFYDVQGGQITLGGTDIRALRLSDLRRQIALVTQEPFLFDDTIRANIAYGQPEATEAAIEAAARDAAAHDFILSLPQGYDTPVGEAGARLSGGQRQRIAIARAFLKNAPILLLDEATSALDTESEALVQSALERLMQGRTTVLVAHRLSTVRKADQIAVLSGGTVVELGQHLDLLAKGGVYSRLNAGQEASV
ncbi:MAG: ABC transporter ATP-binding protein, partial [Asticcacaulis sp.]